MSSFGTENIHCPEETATFFKKVIRYSHFHLLCFLLIYFEMLCFIQIGDSTLNLVIYTVSERLSASNRLLQYFIIINFL